MCDRISVGVIRAARSTGPGFSVSVINRINRAYCNTYSIQCVSECSVRAFQLASLGTVDSKVVIGAGRPANSGNGISEGTVSTLDHTGTCLVVSIPIFGCRASKDAGISEIIAPHHWLRRASEDASIGRVISIGAVGTAACT